MTSRLEELRAKYDDAAQLGLDPFPISTGGNRYNNGGRDLFSPRPEYVQDWEVYFERYPHPHAWGSSGIQVSDSHRNRVQYANGRTTPPYHTENPYE